MMLFERPPVERIPMSMRTGPVWRLLAQLVPPAPMANVDASEAAFGAIE